MEISKAWFEWVCRKIDAKFSKVSSNNSTINSFTQYIYENIFFSVQTAGVNGSEKQDLGENDNKTRKKSKKTVFSQKLKLQNTFVTI